MSTSAERMRRLRARRAAGLNPAEGTTLRPAGELLAPAVEETLAALELGERDAAAAQLARRYAQVIDQAADPAWAARWIGPLLLRALEELRATPVARAAGRAAPPRRGPNRVAQLRAAHVAAKARPSAG